MASLPRAHAFFRPLIKLGKVHLNHINKSQFHKTFNFNLAANKLIYNHGAYSVISYRFQSTDALKPETIFENPSGPSIESNANVTKLNSLEVDISEHAVTNIELSGELIPEPPPIPILETIANQLPSGVEASLASQGLGGWWPPGIAQEYISLIHTSLDVPWWVAISIGTLVIRLVMFPLVIQTQRYVANLNNNLPQMQLLQFKMSEAARSGNRMEAAQYQNDLTRFMMEKNLNPLQSFKLPLAQAPVFISFFIGLRRMANLPMASMKTGGALWFLDLTLTDPLYILPIYTCATFFLVIHMGADGAQMNNSFVLYYFMRTLPLIMFPFIINFPAAVLCYWAASNTISLAQVTLLKIPAIRSSLNIPPIIARAAASSPIKKKGIVEGFKDAMTNAKVTRELDERQRIDEQNFKRAGTGPVPKTYSYDPTKKTSEVSRNSVMAKKKS